MFGRGLYSSHVFELQYSYILACKGVIDLDGAAQRAFILSCSPRVCLIIEFRHDKVDIEDTYAGSQGHRKGRVNICFAVFIDTLCMGVRCQFRRKYDVLLVWHIAHRFRQFCFFDHGVDEYAMLCCYFFYKLEKGNV